MVSLSSWQNFYVIIGSAAAALTGLMFVVITLIMGTRSRQSSGAIAAFATPTLMHFCTALFISASISVPWQALWQPAVLFGLAGLAGMIYLLLVARRIRQHTDYHAVQEDWIWHVLLPLVSYTTIGIAALLLPNHSTLALFGIGAVALLFLFIGIHNAWDAVTYIAVDYSQSKDTRQDQ